MLWNSFQNDYPTVKGFSVRNCQFMMQFYNEYNQELTNTKQAVSHLEDFCHPARNSGWTGKRDPERPVYFSYAYFHR